MKKKLTSLLTKIVQNDHLHAKWLNTLSYLENSGARKIAACEHPTLVKEEMLKHASEEFRHSHYLKRQINKVSSISIPNYSLSYLLGGVQSLQYIKKLDVLTSRLLQKRSNVQEIAYLLVTYAIEIRAKELYPLYEKVLRTHNSKVYVKSIILEEEEHLNEMKRGISFFPEGYKYAETVCSIEKDLYNTWIRSVEKTIGSDFFSNQKKT